MLEREGEFLPFVVNSLCMFLLCSFLTYSLRTRMKKWTVFVVLVIVSNSYAGEHAMHSHRTGPHITAPIRYACLFVCSLVRNAEKRFIASFSWHWVPCARIHQLNLVHSRDWTRKQHAQDIHKYEKIFKSFTIKIELVKQSNESLNKLHSQYDRFYHQTKTIICAFDI